MPDRLPHVPERNWRFRPRCGIGASDPVAELASPTDLALFDDNDPPQILPIGYTMMGNLLFIVTAPGDEDTGFIALKKCSSDDSFVLGETMEEFFELLREPSDD